MIHPSAFVEPGAEIGESTRIWHHVHVRAGAVIGAGCNIGHGTYIDTGVTVGDNVKIQNQANLYQGLTVGDRCFIGPAVTFTNDRYPRAFGHWTPEPIVVHDGASIGANATICPGVLIGQYAMVAAGAVVTRDVDPYTLVAGNPARPIGVVDLNGRPT